MILHINRQQPEHTEAQGEDQQRRLSLLRCLRRMGFYDPEALLGLPPRQGQAPDSDLAAEVEAAAQRQ